MGRQATALRDSGKREAFALTPTTPNHDAGDKHRASEGDEGIGRGFRDTRDAKAEVPDLVRRVADAPGLGDQGVGDDAGVVDGLVAATAGRAILGRQAVCAIKGTLHPLRHIAALAHR